MDFSSNYLLPPLVADKCILVEMEQGELERYEHGAVHLMDSCFRVGQSFLQVSFLSGILGCLSGWGVLSAQVPRSTNDLIATVLLHEDYDSSHRGHFSYLSKERSDRTGGHLWTEKNVETTAGKLRMLIAEDGQPLSGDRAAAEKARLAEIVAHPDVFQNQEQARKDDEQHAKKMLDLLPKAFFFLNERPEGEFVRIDFKPNPDYLPQSMEERVLHGMTGSMLVDPQQARLHLIEGRLSQDMTIGLGLLARIRAGSNFSTKREAVLGNEWKTATVDTDIEGRAVFFKSIGKKEHAEHGDFKPISMNLTVAQAVEMLEK
jgi:hypothetical protein